MRLILGTRSPRNIPAFTFRCEQTMRTAPSWLSLTLVLLTGTAWADDGALRRCRALADAAARLNCYDTLPLGAPAVLAVPVAPPAAPASAAQLAAVGFGLQRADEAVLEIASSIRGLFEGWRAGDRIRLANGQLWQVSDDSSAVYYLRDPRVTVRRAAMGTFVLDIEGARKLPRVRRLE